MKLKFHVALGFFLLCYLSSCNYSKSESLKDYEIAKCSKHQKYFKEQIGSFCSSEQKNKLSDLFELCKTIFWKEHLTDNEIPLTRPKSISTGIYHGERVFYKLWQINEKASFPDTQEIYFDSVTLFDCEGVIVIHLPWKRLYEINNPSILYNILG